MVGVLTEFTWEQEGFALAEGYDEASGRCVGLRIPHEDNAPMVTDATLLVAPDRALRQRAADRVEAPPLIGGEAGDSRTPVAAGIPADGTATGTVVSGPARRTSFYGAVALDPERYGRDFTRIAQEVLQHLAAVPGVDLEITLELRAHVSEGFDDDKVRVVSENARTLKFEQHEFGTD